MFFTSAQPGVHNSTPFGNMIFPPPNPAAFRKPVSSTSKLAFGSHHPPMPCFGVASETNGDRGDRYSFLKICVTLSLKKDVRSTASDFPATCLLQSNPCAVLTEPPTIPAL